MRFLAVLALLFVTFAAAGAQPLPTAVGAATSASGGSEGENLAAAVKALEAGGNTVLIVPREGDGAAAAAAEAPRRTLSQRIAALRLAFEPVILNVPDIPGQLVEALHGAGGGSVGWMVPALVVTLVVVALGAAGGAFAVRVLARMATFVGGPPPGTRAGRITRALTVIARGWIGTAVFFGVGAVATLLIHPTVSPPRVTALMTLSGIAATLAVRAVLRAVLAPRDTALRLLPVPDALARVIYRQLLATVIVTNAIAFVCFWFGYFPLDPLAHQFLLAIAPIFSVVVLLAVAVGHRGAITAAVLGGAPLPRGLRRIAAGLWLPLLVLYLLASGAATVVLVGIEHRLVAGPVLAPTLALVVGMGVAGLLLVVHDRRLVRGITNPRWSELCERVSIGIGAIAGLWVLALMWDVYGTAYALVADHALLLAIVLLVAWAAWQSVRIFVETRLAEEAGDGPGDAEGEGFGPGASRLATLLPIVRNVMLFLIGAIVVMTVLASLGVNIGPLFAGAGVVGLAIGFGAQSLIRDAFSGAFFLLDDAFRRGEYVEVGSVTGQVEKISVRSFQLRHHEGALHTLPFGEIRQLTNYSRDWVIMKLPIRLTYDTDVEKVRKLIKKLGQEMAADPELGPLFLEPPKSQGVVQMEDSAMIIRVKFKTRPGDQFILRRHVFQRLRDLFTANDIHFAHREVTVRVAGTEDEELRRRAALGAVRADLDTTARDQTSDYAAGAAVSGG
ncbi:MAG: hypothetical protein AcusKO_30380 [Acuticoccus sp.]